MDVRGHTAAGIEPDPDVEHLSAVGVGGAGELEPLSEHRICNHGISLT
jgi:hypothetical protein